MSKDWVKAFFERRSRSINGRGDDIVESTSAPYQSLLRAIFLGGPIRAWPTEILDFGCGPGSIRLWLREVGFLGTYIGCDIDEVALSQARRQVQEANASFMHSETELPPVNCAILSNVLVYNQDEEAARLLKRLADSLGDSGTLVVLEPVPAWYWEFVFDGVELRPRSPEEIGAFVTILGFEIVTTVVVALNAIKGVPIFPIAYGLVVRHRSKC